jgi:hypothetical protein
MKHRHGSAGRGGGRAYPCRLRTHSLYPREKLRHDFGNGLKQVLENQAGDFIYIKPGVPHEVFNLSQTEPVVALVARSAAEEWDNIIPYDRNQSRWTRRTRLRSRFPCS